MPSHFVGATSSAPVRVEGSSVVSWGAPRGGEPGRELRQCVCGAPIVASEGALVPGSVRVGAGGAVLASYDVRPTAALLALAPPRPASALGYDYALAATREFDVTDYFRGTAWPDGQPDETRAAELLAASRHYVLLCQHAADSEGDDDVDPDAPPVADDDLDHVDDAAVRDVYAAAVAAYPSTHGMDRMHLNDLLTTIALDKPSLASLRRRGALRYWLWALRSAPPPGQGATWRAAVDALTADEPST
jgi:hypothetical protein